MWTKTVVFLALGVAGCTQILGVGGFHEVGGDGGIPGSDGNTPGSDGGGSGGACDPVAQTGCSGALSRCTWVTDSAGSGHDGCVDPGTVPLGSACGRDGSGSGFPSWDDCEAGTLCDNGACERICDTSRGSAACFAGAFCQIYDGVFTANPGDGLCDPGCDPLADNSFGDGDDTFPPKTGSACTAAQGCYGAPSFDPASPTRFTCAPQGVDSDVHRSACTADVGSDGQSCAVSTGGVYLNGCAQGYEPLLQDTTGSTQIDCVAFCEPHDCYAGNCPDTAKGVAPHACSTSNVRVATSYAFPAGGQDDLNQCYFLWAFEIDGSGEVVQSPYDDDGICLDGTKYTYQDGSGNTYPTSACDTLPGSGSSGPLGTNAANWGCVSIETAGSLGDFGPHRAPQRRRDIFRDLRFPTHAVMRRSF